LLFDIRIRTQDRRSEVPKMASRRDSDDGDEEGI